MRHLKNPTRLVHWIGMYKGDHRPRPSHPFIVKRSVNVLRHVNDPFFAKSAEGGAGSLKLPFARDEKQDCTNYYRSRAGPNWNVDRLLLLHLQFERADLGFMSLLGEAETAIHQPQNAGHNKNYSH